MSAKGRKALESDNNKLQQNNKILHQQNAAMYNDLMRLIASPWYTSIVWWFRMRRQYRKAVKISKRHEQAQSKKQATA